MRNKKYTFHHLGLVHLPASREYMSCAFTQKLIKFSKMLCDSGHTVYFYGARTTKKEYDIEKYVNSPLFRFVETHSVQDIAREWGDGDNRFEIGYDWKNQDFRHDLNRERTELTKRFYETCSFFINKVKKPDDFLLCTQGKYHAPIAKSVNIFLQCESGIGYRGSSPEMFRAFESSYGQNFTYGSEHPFESINGNYYDRVIPNYFDPNDIEYSEKKGNYFLFIGRLIKRKGILTAYLTSKAVKKKLIISGQGGIILSNGHLIDNHPQEYDIPNDSDWNYVGYSDVEKRKKLMAHAKAVFVPTEYLEMFGGVNVEARLSGTPVITTNFGCFPEYIENGIDGYRCNTLKDFVDAANSVEKLNPKIIRKRAERFLMENVMKEYQKWFDDLYNLWENSVNSKKLGWHRL